MKDIESKARIVVEIKAIDSKLSNRFISLDPKGYFLIKLDYEANELILEHYKNNIDKSGRAIDTETGKPLDCKSSITQSPATIYIGKSAKDLGMKISEGNGPFPLSKIDHAIYLGRELQKAEECLKTGVKYIQD